MEKSCGAIVFREENGARKYLLLHYEEGHWDFPKGHVETGESEEETAQREILEETGISAMDFLPGFRERISYSYKRRGELTPKQVIYFLARTSEEKVSISNEHIGFAWLSYDEALERLTYRTAKILLGRAEKQLSSSI